MSRISGVLSLCVCLLGLSGHLSAQVLYGSAVGKVEDQSGAAVAGAVISVSSAATHQSRATRSDTDGRYSIVNVVPGRYELTVMAPGFRKYIQTGIEITINTVSRADVRLELGQVTENVTVAASAAVLQTDKADVHVELDQKAVSN
ncbi:MAG TPA: carboxypeptidase-like regulatory domain-containing protein, partial [Bryobacteraceae bacterium]|nr:carboxypeptidase-like regulatory domain-containing protein [Bryobacteraceae bacterium]